MRVDYLSSTTCVFHAWPNASLPFVSPNFHFTHCNFPLRFNLHRSSPVFSSDFGPRRFLRRSLTPGRPPPPESESSNQKDSGPASTTSLQESTRIFFAVLFWMTLFFWSAIWDGRDNDGGNSTRPRKGSWFRR